MKHPGHLVPFLIRFFLPTYRYDPFAPANRAPVLVLIMILCNPAGSTPRHFALENSIQAPLKTYLVTPSQGRAGKDYDLLIIGESPGCEAQHELAKAKLVTPEGSPLAVLETTTQADCNITAKIRIPADAGIGRVTLWVTNDKNILLGTVQFSIVDFVPPGQIPVNPPAVDVMWSVMPKKIVGDNFGSSIAKKYYAIEIIIGNNSAYNLQLVSVGFELPSDQEIEGLLQRNAKNKAGIRVASRNQDAIAQEVLKPVKEPPRVLSTENEIPGTEKKPLLPTSSYKITRGSLEARQLFDRRTLILSTITALGPIFTGFTPYFHNVNHRGNFTEAINIFSNPLEKGLELVWPDPRSRQRDRFDDQVLRDGLIIKNNTQVRTLAFFPKELLRLPGSVESDAEYNAWSNNAREVRERLGQIVVIGDLIQYVNRISLTPNAPGPVNPPPTINRPNPTRAKQGVRNVAITITGSNLSEAQLSPKGTTGISFSGVKVDENGHVISATVTVEETVAPGTYGIVVSTPNGQDETDFVVEAEKIGNVSIQYKKPKEGEANPVPIEITGKFLHNARITGPSELIIQDITPSADGTSVKATVTVNGTTKAGKYKLSVFDLSDLKNQKEVEFEVLPKG
jgi:hypothetical protein